jgi:sortase A
MMRAGQRNSGANLAVRWWARILLVVGASVLVYCAYIWGDAAIYQALQSRRFDRPLLINASERGADCDTSASAAGFSIGQLQVPRIGLSVVVLEGDDPYTLRRGAGHIPGTAWCGAASNVAIAGHRDTFFRSLRDIREDDEIRLTTLDGFYVYRVESIQVVAAGDVQLLDQTSRPVLTLITCFPFSYIGPAPKRFVVRASQTSSSAAHDSRELGELPESPEQQNVETQASPQAADHHD